MADEPEKGVETAAASALPEDPPGSPWKTLGAHEVYRNPWMRVTEYAVRRPDGSRGIYGVVDPGDNVTIVALDEEQQLYLVGEFRYIVGRYQWKLPSGRVDEGEDELSSAKRELREEAGIEAERWTPLGRYYLSDGVLTQACFIYLATGVRHVQATPESTEIFTIRAMPLSDAFSATLSGELDDAPTVMGVWRTWFHLHQRT